MRNIQNINIRYGSGVPVPCDQQKLIDKEMTWEVAKKIDEAVEKMS